MACMEKDSTYVLVEEAATSKTAPSNTSTRSNSSQQFRTLRRFSGSTPRLSKFKMALEWKRQYALSGQTTTSTN